MKSLRSSPYLVRLIFSLLCLWFLSLVTFKESFSLSDGPLHKSQIRQVDGSESESPEKMAKLAEYVGLYRFERVKDMFPDEENPFPVFRSSAPFHTKGSSSERYDARTAQFLKKHDIKTVISLNPRAVDSNFYWLYRSHDVHYVAVPLRDDNSASFRQFDRVWETYKRHRASGGVLIWSGFGQGHTGVAVSALQIRAQGEIPKKSRKALARTHFRNNHVEAANQVQDLKAYQKQVARQSLSLAVLIIVLVIDRVAEHEADLLDYSLPRNAPGQAPGWTLRFPVLTEWVITNHWHNRDLLKAVELRSERPEHVFRSEVSKTPQQVLAEGGFSSRGYRTLMEGHQLTDTQLEASSSLYHHVRGDTIHSRYISTTTNAGVALASVDNARLPDEVGYIYRIRADPKMICLQGSLNQGFQLSESQRFEHAAIWFIPANQIEGWYRVSTAQVGLYRSDRRRQTFVQKIQNGSSEGFERNPRFSMDSYWSERGFGPLPQLAGFDTVKGYGKESVRDALDGLIERLHGTQRFLLHKRAALKCSAPVQSLDCPLTNEESGQSAGMTCHLDKLFDSERFGEESEMKHMCMNPDDLQTFRKAAWNWYWEEAIATMFSLPEFYADLAARCQELRDRVRDKPTEWNYVKYRLNLAVREEAVEFVRNRSDTYDEAFFHRFRQAVTPFEKKFGFSSTTSLDDFIDSVQSNDTVGDTPSSAEIHQIIDNIFDDDFKVSYANFERQDLEERIAIIGTALRTSPGTDEEKDKRMRIFNDKRLNTLEQWDKDVQLRRKNRAEREEKPNGIRFHGRYDFLDGLFASLFNRPGEPPPEGELFPDIVFRLEDIPRNERSDYLVLLRANTVKTRIRKSFDDLLVKVLEQPLLPEGAVDQIPRDGLPQPDIPEYVQAECVKWLKIRPGWLKDGQNGQCRLASIRADFKLSDVVRWNSPHDAECKNIKVDHYACVSMSPEATTEPAYEKAKALKAVINCASQGDSRAGEIAKGDVGCGNSTVYWDWDQGWLERCEVDSVTGETLCGSYNPKALPQIMQKPSEESGILQYPSSESDSIAAAHEFIDCQDDGIFTEQSILNKMAKGRLACGTIENYWAWKRGRLMHCKADAYPRCEFYDPDKIPQTVLDQAKDSGIPTEPPPLAHEVTDCTDEGIFTEQSTINKMASGDLACGKDNDYWLWQDGQLQHCQANKQPPCESYDPDTMPHDLEHEAWKTGILTSPPPGTQKMVDCKSDSISKDGRLGNKIAKGTLACGTPEDYWVWKRDRLAHCRSDRDPRCNFYELDKMPKAFMDKAEASGILAGPPSTPERTVPIHRPSDEPQPVAMLELLCDKKYPTITHNSPVKIWFYDDGTLAVHCHDCPDRSIHQLYDAFCEPLLLSPIIVGGRAMTLAPSAILLLVRCKLRTSHSNFRLYETRLWEFVPQGYSWTNLNESRVAGPLRAFTLNERTKIRTAGLEFGQPCEIRNSFFVTPSTGMESPVAL
ncbi:hypothetical protein CP533_1366 [Ophiocordyceps camponoti-saundersi (nom. inval.)]|nr:hypothetical protein CP533_1366 [Ophiocordyceps camponoti-saundersi (nom. inval.)]